MRVKYSRAGKHARSVENNDFARYLLRVKKIYLISEDKEMDPNIEF